MTSPKRIALLGFHLESNSFAPVSGEWDFRSLCYMAGGEISADMVLPNPSLPTEIPAFAAEIPFVAAVVELEEGVRMATRLIGCDHERLALDLPVEVEFELIGEDFRLPVFRLRES